MKVIKRNGKLVDFDRERIYNAILKAMTNGSGIVRKTVAEKISVEIEKELSNNDTDKVDIASIEKMVYSKLIEKKQKYTAQAYVEYKAVREFQRKRSDIDEAVCGIVNGNNKEVLDENSNKNGRTLATQRDLIAGEFSKDYCRRLLLPAKVVQMHDEGSIHFHDADYFIQNMFNCCLVDLKDMLENGTVINGKLIETPKSFQTACTVATQIVQQVANGQYGGQTISLAHLAPYVRVSYNKWVDRIRKDLESIGYDDKCTEKELNSAIDKMARTRLREEVKSGIQTIQYQINTFNTSNGQAPFLTIFMYIREEPGYEKETAMLIEEMLNLRYLGIKNEVGVYVTPAFPKLIYVLDDNNVPKDSEYRYLTDLAIKTVAKRMMPDFVSAKILREQYDGEVFPCMGCRSWLSPWKDPETGKYKWYGRFNQGVVTLNLPDVALTADCNEKKFWEILEERLKLCKDALMLRHEHLLGTKACVSPIHWQHGAIARLKADEKIDKYLKNGYSTISLGYTGLYECVLALTGKSHTTKEGKELALKIMNKMKDTCDKWKRETGIGFGLYGTPSESTTYKFAKSLRKKFGVIEGITDKNYIVNSFHVDIKEKISAFDKIKFEAEFQKISSGGCVSYVEVPNMSHNLEALNKLVEFMHENIRYAEINTKSDYCHVCGFEGEILLDDSYNWYCPNCGNKDTSKMNVCRRTCGYLGDNFWNKGRTEDIGNRELHIDNSDCDFENLSLEDIKKNNGEVEPQCMFDKVDLVDIRRKEINSRNKRKTVV